MKKRIPFLLFIFYVSVVCAQNVFESSQLNEIYARLPIECKNVLLNSSDNTCKCEINNNKVDVKVIFNASGKVSHVGINLFEINTNLIYSSSVLFFLERTFLDQLLINNTNLIARKSKENGIDIAFNYEPFGKGNFTNINNILGVLSGNFDFGINEENKKYTALFYNGFNQLSISYPANYNIVSGMDKKEYGEHIAAELQSFKRIKATDNSERITQLKKYKTDLYVSIGDSYFKSITSSKYYEAINDSLAQIIFTNKFLLESFANMFLAPFESNENKKIDITHKVYGTDILNYQLNIADFIDYFDKEFKLYFGIESANPDKLAGTLIMFNKDLNFINLLHIQTNDSTLFNNSYPIKARLFTNIPSDNIKNLFSEYDENYESTLYDEK